MPTKNNQFNNVIIDACWSHRSGENDVINHLKSNYPDLSSEELVRASEAGEELNTLLWKLSVRCWGKEISEHEFANTILRLYPTLNVEMAAHLLDNAMYDSM